MTALELKKLLEHNDTSCKEIMTSVLDRIDKDELKINAYISIRDSDLLLKEAETIDKKRKKGDRIGPLSGLPIAVKDNINTEGITTTCASKMLENYVPVYNATVINSIKAADGIIVGKTNMDEFAMGSSTENSAFKTTRNPHNLDYVPGGTSGGSAAAIAANEAILALASDTGGSIRQPASYCGVVGFKPTYGRVSRYGLIAYGSSLDQIGTITKSVKDSALLMNVIAGFDPKDSTSVRMDVPDYLAALNNNNKYRIGIPKEYFGQGLDEEVAQAIESVIASLEKDGFEIVQVSLPHTEYAVATYYIIICSEASSNLSRYSGVHYGYRAKNIQSIEELYKRSRSEGFGTEVKRRIMLGTFALSSGYYDAYYKKASKVRMLIRKDFEEAFKQCDVIVHPVAPGPAFRIGENVDDPLKMYLIDIYSVIANLVGLPAISVPIGKTVNGLPIGIQCACNHFEEVKVLSIASRIEYLMNKITPS